MSKSTKCACENCGAACRDRLKKRHGLRAALAARPWIWVVLGYLMFVSVISSMVVIAVKHQQPDMLIQKHGR